MEEVNHSSNDYEFVVISFPIFAFFLQEWIQLLMDQTFYQQQRFNCSRGHKSVIYLAQIWEKEYIEVLVNTKQGGTRRDRYKLSLCSSMNENQQGHIMAKNNRLDKLNNFNYKKTMSSKSIALSKALSALQHNFPSLILPTVSPNESFLSYLDSLATHLLPSSHLPAAVEKMKNASDAQEYRIQRSLLETDCVQSFNIMEELCYEAQSTGVLADRQGFGRQELSQGNSIDDIWWNAEKKIESIEYFLD